MNRRLRAALAAALIALTALTALVTAGCGGGLSSLPLPAPSIGPGGYQIRAVFANALNLPGHAKVKLSGADVGQLETMVAQNYTAVTTLRIMAGVRIPVGSTAELRSATPLGDVFVAIKPPTPLDPAAPLLKDGDTIGLDATAAAATVESVLSSAALLVNGGTVRNFTNIINGAGKATGNQGEALGKLLKQSNELLGKIDARSADIETALTETTRLADRLDAKNRAVTEVLQAAAPATDVLAEHTGRLGDIVEELGAITGQLRRFPSLAGTDTSGHSFIKDANTVSAAWNDVAVHPDTSLAALNRLVAPMVKSTLGSSISVHVSLDRLVFGSMPDAGFKGDPVFHGPKRYNWAQLAGSIKYTLWRLQERVVGRGPNDQMAQVPWNPIGPPQPAVPGEQLPAGPPQPGAPG